MYNILKQDHPKYGKVIEVVRIENGIYDFPNQVYNEAKLQRRLWIEEGFKKVRILIDGKVLTVSQTEKWSYDEYKRLPKCKWCCKILEENVFTNTVCDSLFCCTVCADHDTASQMEKMNDEEECEYL